MSAAGWVCENGLWLRRVGPWSLCLREHPTPAGWSWVAHLVYRIADVFDKDLITSGPLGKSGFAKVEDVQVAADAWLVEITMDLLKLVDVSK